jgi:LacI family transcriptional regulator
LATVSIVAKSCQSTQQKETEGMRVNEKAATIYDIAKLAGVNPSTVSRALTTPGRINAATEAKAVSYTHLRAHETG